MTIELDRSRDEIPPIREFASHKRQYHRFLHLTKWFVIHMAALLSALYFFIITGQSVPGSILLVLSIGALAYGIFSTPQVARDVGAAVAHDIDRS